MRITGDSDEGKLEVDNFIDPESRYPVIATTSKLLTTGIDVQTCKLIVLDRVIKSMTEFKQIIGRGTRINEDYNKFFFTIMDFKKATELFSDPDFDGDPVQIYESTPSDPVLPPIIDFDGPDETIDDEDITIISEPPDDVSSARRVKYVVDDVEVSIVAERVQYYGKDGKLITESLKDYTRKAVREEYDSLDAFLKRWNEAERKQAVIDELEEAGVLFEPLAETVGKDFGPFDLICHVAFDQPPLTRKERAANVRKQNYFAKYGDTARTVLDGLLDKYADEGIEDIESMNVLKLQPINQQGTPIEIIKSFGGKDKYEEAIKELKNHIYIAA